MYTCIFCFLLAGLDFLYIQFSKLLPYFPIKSLLSSQKHFGKVVGNGTWNQNALWRPLHSLYDFSRGNLQKRSVFYLERLMALFTSQNEFTKIYWRNHFPEYAKNESFLNRFWSNLCETTVSQFHRFFVIMWLWE